MKFKEEWTVESAMEILQHPTVDSKIWSEAVEWLLLYGPPEIRETLQAASGHATKECFPELQPEGFTPDGQPCYNVTKLAKSLGISEEEVQEMLTRQEEKHGLEHLFGNGDTHKIQ